MGQNRSSRHSLLLIFFCCNLLLLSACAKQDDSGSNQQASSGPSGPPESDYCSNVAAVTSPVTLLTGNANYNAWKVTDTGLGSGNAVLTNPIRRAEVRVKDSTGTVIQCGETDNTGSFSVQIPQAAGTFSLEVNSRALNNYVNVSILDSPYTNVFYSIVSNFNLSGTEASKAIGTLTAPHVGTLEGGAFNIMDQILKANEFLRANTTCSVCTTFTVAPKVKVYWKKGVNPGDYFSVGPISFFYPSDSDPTQKALYILGGKSGDTDNADTDHFDNSVIVHEYGHFLENTYAKTDSPGGSHNGNFIIDPRLAWGEGWANFFSAAVLGIDYYRDTYGNYNGKTGVLITLNMRTASRTQDIPTKSGEGNFREVSVSRSLYEILAKQAANFSYLWNTFTNSTTGFKSSTNHFRNVGLFHQILLNFLQSNDSAQVSGVQTVISNELQMPNRTDYAAPLITGATCSLSIRGTTDLYNASSNNYVSDQFQSNDFYQYYHSGGNLNLRLRYTQTGTPITDLDLVLYQPSYVYGDTTTMVSFSAHDYPESGGTGMETINVPNLAAGYYMVNVKVYSQNFTASTVGASVNYSLDSNGATLCPSP